MASEGKKAPKKKKARRKRASKESKGLFAKELVGDPPKDVAELRDRIEGDGGAVLSVYREPLGGHWQIFAALPLSKVKPVVFQRNLSETHVKRLTEKINRLNRFLDPIIVIRSEEGEYLTPNGLHRTTALQKLGAKSIVALVIPEVTIAHQILALNTEKAPNVKEKSLEAIRLARELQKIGPSEEEAGYTDQFEEPSFLTLGVCYEQKAQFSGGAYYSVLRRTEGFFEERLGKALSIREKRATRLFKLDDGVSNVVKKLKEQGLNSPFLKTFVVARINPLRFRKGDADFDDTLDTMMESLKKFDPAKIRPHHLAGMAAFTSEEG